MVFSQELSPYQDELVYLGTGFFGAKRMDPFQVMKGGKA